MQRTEAAWSPELKRRKWAGVTGEQGGGHGTGLEVAPGPGRTDLKAMDRRLDSVLAEGRESHMVGD